jgi:hypothetical protein
MAPHTNEHHLLSSGCSRTVHAPLCADQVAGHFTHPLFGFSQNWPDVNQNSLFSLTLIVSIDQAMIFCICQLVINSLICQEPCRGIISVHLILRFDSLPVLPLFLSEIIEQRKNNARDGNVTQPDLEAIILLYRCPDEAGIRNKSI